MIESWDWTNRKTERKTSQFETPAGVPTVQRVIVQEINRGALQDGGSQT